MLLLDTHVWLWVVGPLPRVGRKVGRLIEQAAAREQLRVSTASVFELSMLTVSGRIRLSVPVNEWVEGALGTPGIRLAELTTAIAVDAGQIPRAALADPMDRILAATARRLDASLVTADRALLAFAKATHLRAVNATQ